jgi:hypothetical protein
MFVYKRYSIKRLSQICSIFTFTSSLHIFVLISKESLYITVFKYQLVYDLLIKVTGHLFWRFAENRYCALNIRPIFIKFSPNVLQCMQNILKL